MKGLIFSVKRYSIHDGPGIRVTFFMKGCPLRCIWCHNPEGISPLPETITETDKLGDKEFTRNEVVGKYYTVNDIIDILGKERVFINESGGGVTFSGGEPLLQLEFLIETLKRCKALGYHTAVDTSGYSSKESFRLILPYTDLFLYDLKHIDNIRHTKLTGVSHNRVLENYKFLVQNGKDIMVRIPIIPGMNDEEKYIKELLLFLKTAGTESLRKINLLPYHRTGSSKYRKFNLAYKMGDTKPPSGDEMHTLKQLFSTTGVSVKIGG